MGRRQKRVVILYPDNIITIVSDFSKVFSNVYEALEDSGYVYISEVYLSKGLTKKLFEKDGKRYICLNTRSFYNKLSLIYLYEWE